MRNAREFLTGRKFIKRKYGARYPLLGWVSATGLRESTGLSMATQRQPERTCQRPQQIRCEIVPSGIAPGQYTLMPFVDQAQQQRAGHGHEHHSSAGSAAGHADGGADQGEDRDMRQLVPGGGNQIHCEGLCAADEKRAAEPREQHCRGNARVA